MPFCRNNDWNWRSSETNRTLKASEYSYRPMKHLYRKARAVPIFRMALEGKGEGEGGEGGGFLDSEVVYSVVEKFFGFCWPIFISFLNFWECWNRSIFWKMINFYKTKIFPEYFENFIKLTNKFNRSCCGRTKRRC